MALPPITPAPISRLSHPPVALALIVKNEAPTIAQTLESARRALGPGPTVVHDTGSTDGTVEAVWAGGKTDAGDLHLCARPFDDFASARNACLADAFKHSPLVCMVDAGVLVSGALALYPEARRAGALTAVIRLGAITYERPQVFTRGWQYHGRVHEYAEGPGSKAPSGLVFDYCLRDVSRARRWLRDLALLEGDTTPRGKFYYAQTLDCLDRKAQAKAAYLERAAIEGEGFWQERVVSYMRCIPIAKTLAEARHYCERALAIDPSRGDAWIELCAHLEREQKWSELYAAATRALMLGPRAGALFENIDRVWRAHVYAGDAASSRGQYAIAQDHWRMALVSRWAERIPQDERAALQMALAFAGEARS